MRHFWAYYATAPSTTAGTFVLPVWAEAQWWRLTGAHKSSCTYLRRGHALFTSPEWKDVSRTNPVPTRRVHYQTPTTRGVVVINVAPAGPIDNLSTQATGDLPRLSGGDDYRDLLLHLRKLPSGFVCLMRRTPAYGSACVLQVRRMCDAGSASHPPPRVATSAGGSRRP